MTTSEHEGTGSALLVQEYFDNGDVRFLFELYALRETRTLKGLAARWVSDARPFARDALVAYIDDGCARPGHRGLIKKLFKCAEDARDHALLVRFAVAFDTLGRRKMGVTWSYAARAQVEMPVHDRGVPGSLHEATRAGTFRRRTRRYLVRRAFRGLRAIGRKDPTTYVALACDVLARYRDAQLASAAQLLDAWTLVHIAYGRSAVLRRPSSGVRLADGAALADLVPAPMFVEAWKKAFEPLFDLAVRAQSRTVRVWAVGMLRTHHANALETLSLDRIRALLRSGDEALESLGVERLAAASGLESLSVEAWLELLSVQNFAVVRVVVDLAMRTLSRDRLTDAQCLTLAQARIASVAEVGLSWVRARPPQTAEALSAVLVLGNAPVASVRATATTWLLSLITTAAFGRGEHLRDLLDARFEDTRSLALDTLRTHPTFSEMLPLWGVLAESPYRDVRTALLRRAEPWSVGLTPDALRQLWAMAVLSVQGGGREKPRVLRQLAERWIANPDERAALVPLLRVGLRSVRATEQRAALAALTRAAFASADVRIAVESEFPDLTFGWERAS